jgi:methylated-DNA-[protein]-cysteine S-methyltransferase
VAATASGRRSEFTLEIETVESPLGDIVAVHGPGGVCALAFTDRFDRVAPTLARRFPGAHRVDRPPGPTSAALIRYFEGRLDALDALDLDPGGTPFQAAVWGSLRRVRAGTTATYRDLARALDHPTATRAVGAANGRNPISLAIPCHRIVGADGRLVGYGGGLERKAWLLRHEGARLLA